MRTAECLPNVDGECPPDVRLFLPKATEKVSVLWPWLDEYQGAPTRFAPGSVVTVGTLPAFSYKASTTPFGVQALFVENGSGFGDYLANTPGSSLTFNPTTSLYPEPDVGQPAATMKIQSATTEENRSLRAGVAKDALVLESTHVAVNNASPCIDWSGFPSKLWLPDPPFLDAPGLIWGDGGPSLGGKVLMSVDERWRRAVRTAPTAEEWLGAVGVSAPWGTASTRDSRLPTLLHVETASRPRFAILTPTGEDELTVTYDAVKYGLLPESVASGAQLLTDGEFAAVVDFAAGRVQAYDAALDMWFVNPLPPEVTSGAGLGLSGATLVAHFPTGALAMDVLDGKTSRIPGVPGRSRSLVTSVRGSRTIVFAGGIDDGQRVHDDIWTYSLSRPTAGAVRTRSDTTSGRILAGEAVLDPGDGTYVTAYLPSGATAGFVTTFSRADGGWEGGEFATPPSCAADDSLGGRLCPTAPGPWGSYGRLACGNALVPYECRGVPSGAGSVRVLPGNGVRAAVAQADGLWFLKASNIEHRTLVPGTLTDLSTRSAPLVKGVDFDAGPEGALVATKGGLVFATDAQTGLNRSPATPICGVPLRVARLASGTWAVMTTVAVAVVTTSTGAPVVSHQALLRPRQGDDDDWELEFLNPGSTPPACSKNVPDALIDVLRDRSWITPANGDLFVGRGHIVARLHLGESSFEIERADIFPDRIKAARYDAEGKRLYVNGAHTKHVFDFRGAGLGHTTGHAAEAWVVRSDAGFYMATIDAQARVVVATTASR